MNPAEEIAMYDKLTDTPVNPGVPHNREAEEAVIGSIIINPEVYYDIAQFLKPDDFYIHRNRWIWEAIERLRKAHTPIDLLTISEDMERNGQLGEVGGSAYITSLINQVPTSTNAEAYAHIVEGMSMRRKMIQAANKIASLAFSGDDPVSAYAKGKSFYDKLSGNGVVDFKRLRDLASQEYDRMDKAARGERPDVLSTGFLDMDDLLDGGFRPGDLILVAGRPGMGKTAFKLDVALNVARAGRNVAIFSLEMSNEQVTQRIVSKSGIAFSSIRTGNMQEREWPLFTQAIEETEDLGIFMSDLPAIRPAQLRAKAHALHRQVGLDLIIVDYIQLMQNDTDSENRVQEVSAISRTMKLLARELDIPVLCGAQLSRAPEQRTDKRPVLSDLRESGSLEQDADIVTFLYRDSVYNEGSVDKLAEVNVAKHRNGAVGKIELAFNGQFMRFDNCVKFRPNEEAEHNWQNRKDMGD